MNEAVLVQPDLLTDVINQESDDSLTESGPPDDFVCQGLGSLACATCPAADRCRELQMNGLEAEAPKSGLSDLLADDDKTIWADNYDPNLVDADSINIFDYATKQQSSSEIDDSPKNLQSVEDKPDVAPEPSSKIEENEPVDQTAESEYAQIDESPEGVIVDNNEANKKLVVSPEDRTEGAQAHPASELEVETISDSKAIELEPTPEPKQDKPTSRSNIELEQTKKPESKPAKSEKTEPVADSFVIESDMTGIDSSGDIKAQPANLDVDKNTTPIIDQIKAETDQLFKKLDIETKTDLEASTPDYSDNYTDQTFSKERVISKSEYLSSVETDNTEQPSIESSVDEEIIISDQSIETSEPESLQYSRIILNQPQNEISIDATEEFGVSELEYVADETFSDIEFYEPVLEPEFINEQALPRLDIEAGDLLSETDLVFEELSLEDAYQPSRQLDVKDLIIEPSAVDEIKKPNKIIEAINRPIDKIKSIIQPEPKVSDVLEEPVVDKVSNFKIPKLRLDKAPIVDDNSENIIEDTIELDIESSSESDTSTKPQIEKSESPDEEIEQTPLEELYGVEIKLPDESVDYYVEPEIDEELETDLIDLLIIDDQPETEDPNQGYGRAYLMAELVGRMAVYITCRYCNPAERPAVIAI